MKLSDIFVERELQEIEYARKHVRERENLGASPYLACVIIAKQAQLIEQMQLERLQATPASQKTQEFLVRLFEQVDGLAQPIKATGVECHFDMSSHVVNGEVVIVLKPVAVRKEGRLPRGIGAIL
jgi:hypothetical protein